MSIDVIIICITVLLSFIILSYISLKITSLFKEEIKEDLILSDDIKELRELYETLYSDLQNLKTRFSKESLGKILLSKKNQ